jgi:ABC-2 type transport system permease protein
MTADYARERAEPGRMSGPSEKAVHPMSGLINGVIVRLTLRATLSRKRALLFALPAIVLIVISALLAATAHSPVWPPEFLGTVGFSLVIPLTALIIGGSVLGGEIEDGSIVHLLATPVSRLSVILSKYLVAVMLTVAFAAIPEYLAGAIAKGPSNSLTIGLFVGALAASVMYNALFVMLTAVFSPGRALAFGLLYVLLWEGLLANLVSGVRLLSIGHYALAIANSIAHSSALKAQLTLSTGIILGVIVTILTLMLAVRRLSSFSIKGDLI